MKDTKNGWGWFSASGIPAASTSSESESADDGLAKSFARCFRGQDGERVLQHLRSMTIEQTLGPGASDTLLRHLEGQRQLVAHISTLIKRGRNDPG